MLWIASVAALLAGIVALNVAVLDLNLGVQRIEQERRDLAAENAELSSRLSSASAAGRIESIARNRLGLVEPVSTVYLELDSAQER